MTRGDTTSTALDHNAYWSYTYNDKGELASGKKKDASNNAFPGLNNEYTYDSIGNRTEWKTGGDTSGANLRTIPYTANNLNQYTSIDSANSPDYDVTGDAVAAGTVTVDGNATGRRGAWFHRELSVSNDASAVYATNLVRVVNAGVTNSTNVVTFVSEDPEVPEYDEDGNLTQDGRWVYTWTGENRLRKMETRSGLPAGVPNLTLEFKYDHMGRRIQKVVKDNGTTVEDRRYVWHGWQLLWELDSSSALKKLYTWGPDVSHTLEGAGTVGGLLSVMDVSGAWDSWVSFPCYDGNGNVMGLVGYAYGNILCKYEYDPYGRLIRTSGNTTLAASNPFLFSTKFLDRETGLSYYGYRYYSAEKGRWPSRDPYAENDTINLYSFVRNSSIGSMDMLGLKRIDANPIEELDPRPPTVGGGGRAADGVTAVISGSLEYPDQSCSGKATVTLLIDDVGNRITRNVWFPQLETIFQDNPHHDTQGPPNRGRTAPQGAVGIDGLFRAQHSFDLISIGCCDVDQTGHLEARVRAANIPDPDRRNAIPELQWAARVYYKIGLNSVSNDCKPSVDQSSVRVTLEPNPW